MFAAKFTVVNEYELQVRSVFGARLLSLLTRRFVNNCFNFKQFEFYSICRQFNFRAVTVCTHGKLKFDYIWASI